MLDFLVFSSYFRSNLCIHSVHLDAVFLCVSYPDDIKKKKKLRMFVRSPSRFCLFSKSFGLLTRWSETSKESKEGLSGTMPPIVFPTMSLVFINIIELKEQ